MSGFEANTTYKDTLDLPTGCYTLEMTDTGENGLNWWAASAQGSGYMRIRSTTSSQTFKTFEADFGAGFKYGFTKGAPVTIPETELPSLEFTLYPNPTSDRVYLSLAGLNADNLTVKITDIYGKVHFVNNYNTTYNMEFDGSVNVSEFASGTYFVEVISGDKRMTKKVVISH